MLLLVFSLLAMSCKTDEIAHAIELNIDQNWVFSEAGTNNWLDAKVPGTVHADLLDNGIIEDPHFRLNENEVQWVETKDWVYKTNITINDELLLFSVIELHFDGLDTYASVYLNDKHILEADNMFLGWSVDVKPYLETGNNELRIVFHSPVNKGMEKLTKLDYLLPAANEQAPENERTNVFTRKAPFHYGWDWGPRLVTSGIWRPVTLRAHDYAVIEDIYVETTDIKDKTARLKGNAEIRVIEAGEYNLSLTINDRKQTINENFAFGAGNHVIDFDFVINNPKLWWTNGLGEPYLYDFTFNLSRKRDVISRKELSVGVRTLELVQLPDEEGYSFHFEINGVPVFAKGANVIPSETLTPSVSEETYRRLIKNAVDANMNMLRVWGGAIYEEDIFYELCDRNGIMVWQDFMFACALQPGDEDHLENIRKEAEYNVKRLRNHASIALWCGNNENLHGWHHWGWNERYEPDVRDFVWNTYERIFYDILPAAVQKHDSKTAYWASSPSAYGDQLADRKSGDEHDWTIWFGQRPFSAYGENVPRFVSEYGLQAFPVMQTIREFSNHDEQDLDSEVMRHRQRSKMNWIESGFDGNDMIKWYMNQYYNVPESFEHFVYVSNLLHAKAYKTAIEAHRRNMPYTMGSLYWQLNDSWPTISWATVDYYGRWKASHYGVRDANAPLLLSAVIENDELLIYAVNDLLEKNNLVFNVSVVDFAGNSVFNFQDNAIIEANHSTQMFSMPVEEIITADIDKSQLVAKISLHENGEEKAVNLFYFEEPKNLKLPEADVMLSTRRTENGYEVLLTTNALAKNIFLDTPYGDVKFSDNYFDMLPGETKKVEMITTRDIDSGNDLKILMLNDL